MLVVALLLMVLLFMLGAALLATSESEAVIASNDEWSEGAFYAAEAAVQVAIDQLSGDPASNVTEVVPESDIGEQFTYRSGGRDDAEPQPPAYVGAVHGTGYSIGAGTGYNTSEYIFDIYQINGTGTGPRNAIREVEVQAQYGPLAR